ncbi:MAG: SRPBCC family protein [Chloroflexales bacterium]|nr:SRPBCC family protein [Chloroflexales bacterium]
MDIIRAVIINAPAEKLWKILAEDYDKVGEWASEIEKSTPNPDLPLGEERACSPPGFGDVKETITQFDETRKTFSYAADVQKMPFFVCDLSNTWRVESKGTAQ